jgi:ubiquinone biosynthesis protein Coq4
MGRIAIAIHNATTAFTDPTRADAVAALGEVTGLVTLRKIHNRMMQDPTGRRILQERPVVTKANIPYDKLIAEAPDNIDSAGDDLTFGQAYGAFLKVHGFDPDERDEVNFIEDETLAYIMLRYRQVCGGLFNASKRKVYKTEIDSFDYSLLCRSLHPYLTSFDWFFLLNIDALNRFPCRRLSDALHSGWQNHDFFHALTGLPPTVLGELGLKWLELFQTGLPIAALSCTVGSLRLDDEERRILQDYYLPWAIEHTKATADGNPNASSSPFLMNVYYEKEFDTPIRELRKRLNLVAAPSVFK